MSEDSSKIDLQSQKAEAFVVAIHTVAVGLLLYLVPPIISVFTLVVLLNISGMDGVQAGNWLQEATLGQFLFVAITEAIVIAALWILMSQAKIKLKDIGLRRPKFSNLQYVLVGFAVYFAIYAIVAVGVALFTNIDLEQEQQIGFNTDVSGVSLLMAAVSLVVLPPLVEEILFRGYLYNRFRQAFSVVWAALLVSVLFGIAHLQLGSGNVPLWIAAIDTFILSLVLVYIREKTGNIWTCVGVHAMKNAMAFVILFNVLSL